MDKKTYQRMVAELRQLSNRIDKLNVFIVKDCFKKLSGHEQIMLMEQLNAMKWYYHSLKNRVLFYHDKEVKENGRPFTEDPVK